MSHVYNYEAQLKEHFLTVSNSNEYREETTMSTGYLHERIPIGFVSFKVWSSKIGEIFPQSKKRPILSKNTSGEEWDMYSCLEYKKLWIIFIIFDTQLIMRRGGLDLNFHHIQDGERSEKQ